MVVNPESQPLVIPTAVLEADLSPVAFLVLCQFMRCEHGNNVSFITISEAANIEVLEVIHAVEELVDRGFVSHYIAVERGAM